jgi:lipopolysaccharide heptosyltransferase II
MGCHRAAARGALSVNQGAKVGDCGGTTEGAQPPGVPGIVPSSEARPERSLRQRFRLLILRLAGKSYPRSVVAASLRSILLIRPDHLGDMLFLTPGLHALRAAMPEAHITVLAGPWSAGVLQDNPDLDVLARCPFPGFERQPKRDWLAPYRLLRTQAQALRSSRFDAAVVLRFDHWWGAWLAAAAGIPRRIGYDWPETWPFLTEVLPYQPDRHEVEQNGDLLAGLLPGSPLLLGRTRFAVRAQDRAWAVAWLADHGADGTRPLVAIHPGAGAVVKQWPVTAWAEVAGGLAGVTGAQILLTGSAAERRLTQALAEALASPVVNAAGETGLGQLAALQERCTLVLGSDCGPLHLAVAVGVPTVHLYGPISPVKFGPWGDPEQHIVLATDWACSPCNRLDWPSRALVQHQCMAAIKPEQVLRAALDLLDNRRSAP